MKLTFTQAIIGFGFFLATALPVCADSTEVAAKRSATSEDSVLSTPTLSEDYFPCTSCHDKGKVNYTRRPLLEDHPEIILEHDAENRWCLDCHAPLDRDKLHLASGELIGFNESFRLCGQCHGPTYRDWKAGVHGKRTGKWNGKKTYFLCVHCHNPHSPAIKPIAPFPAPLPPVGKPFLFGVKKK